jgi:molecular chaperone DnaJ
MAKRDYYEVLGVDKSAGVSDIKKAYRTQAMKYHPDRNPGDKAAEAKFKEATEAYEVLGDEKLRERYDQYGHAGVESQGGHGGRSAEDMFGDLFGGGGAGSIFEQILGGGRGGRDRNQGADLQMHLEITFREAVNGVTKTIEIKRNESCETCSGSGAKPGTKAATCRMCGGAGKVRQQQGFFIMETHCPQCSGSGKTISDPCTTCRGQGVVAKKTALKVPVPAGINDSTQLRMNGEGEAGRQGGRRGDLYIVLRVRPDPFFERHDDNLVCKVPVTYAQAALGAEIEVPTLTGNAKLKIPAGTQPGEYLRMRGLGVKGEHGGRGDQLVMVDITVPKKTTERQKELLRELGQIEEATGDQRSFFDKLKAMFD